MASSRRGGASLLPAVGGTALMLALAWYLKAPCRHAAPWVDGGVWKRGCYTDIWPLYGGRGFHDQWPYLEAFNEYPPVTAFVQGVLGRLAGDAGMFLALNAMLLGGLALVTTAVLVRGGVKDAVWAWALGTPLLFYAFHNWDLLAILPATAGMVLWLRGRVGWGGALIALAACAKWYPAILLPILGMDLIRRERGLGPQGWRFGLAAVGVLAIVNVPAYLAAPAGFVEPYTFHSERSATIESHWFAIKHYAHRWDVPGHELLEAATQHGLVYVAALATALSLAVWRGRIDVRAAAALGIVGWLVVSPVLSMQYALWIVAPLLLAGMPAHRFIPFFTVDLLVFIAVWRFFAGEHGFDRDYEPLAIASMLRLAALLALCVWLIRHGRREAAMAPGVDAPGPETLEAGADADARLAPVMQPQEPAQYTQATTAYPPNASPRPRAPIPQP